MTKTEWRSFIERGVAPMSNRIQRHALVSMNPTLEEYAAGASQRFIRPVADFIAPVVPVPMPVGHFKRWTEKSRFRLPDSRRAYTGRATVIEIEGQDVMYDCSPNALDLPVDTATGEDQAALVRDALDLTFDVAGAIHERQVITTALSAAGPAEVLSWSPGNKPIVDINSRILTLIKRAKCSEVRVLFGATAWDIFTNHEDTARKAKNDLSWENSPALFHANARYMTSYAIQDANAEGLAEDIQFLLDGSVLIFVCRDNPTRRDPSFMKTFRLEGNFFRGTYESGAHRTVVSSVDWSEDVRNTNTVGAVRLDVHT